ncbi:hypothetical protein BB561_003855 [Smittium simulii]|uniref:CCHC-type domain-containing protein n=1 Tax=Smittium simulii TaxID=133385 RepID=A0A2T9YJD8_9FUNG|nr:hypothetical protein BB561_003855 [Smittium simulii]
MFEGLPEKFTGNSNSEQDVSTWVDKFKLVSDIKAWDETTQLKILELWLDGQAYEWYKRFKERLPKVTIQSALMSLTSEFSRTKIGTLRELLEIDVEIDETIPIFNSRFMEIWNLIPPKYYTEEIVKETYLSKISEIDREIWWKLVQLADSKTPRSLMEEADTYYQIKMKYGTKPEKTTKSVSVLNTEYNRIVQNSKNNDPLDELTQSIKELILLNKKSLEEKNVPTCQNCGRRGHVTESCYSKRKPKEGNTDSEQKSMLALTTQNESINKSSNVTDPPNPSKEVIIATAENKRIRVGDLLNNHYPGTTRKITVDNSQPKPMSILSKKSRKQPKKTFRSLIPRRILDSPAPISNAELFKLKPELIKSMNEEIKTLGQNSAKNYLLYGIDAKDEEPKTFILAKITNKEVPIFIDTGAMNSIIDYKVLNSLNITPSLLDTPHYIKPVGGARIALNHYIRLNVLLEEDFQLSATFLVMKDCAVPILMGMDILQENEANINYSHNVLTFSLGSKCSVQLYSKEELDRLEDSSWESEDEDNNSLSDNLVMYASAKMNILDCSESDNSIHSEADSGMIISVLSKYDHIFVDKMDTVIHPK